MTLKEIKQKLKEKAEHSDILTANPMTWSNGVAHGCLEALRLLKELEQSPPTFECWAPVRTYLNRYGDREEFVEPREVCRDEQSARQAAISSSQRDHIWHNGHRVRGYRRFLAIEIGEEIDESPRFD